MCERIIHITKSIALIVLMSLVTPSCMANNTPTKVISLSYRENACFVHPTVLFELNRLDDGTYVLKNGSNRPYEEAEQVVVPAEFVDSIRQIVAEEKMREYQSYYHPEYQVLDGITWSLNIYFSDKTSVHSSGHEEWPEGNGLQRLVKYLKEVWEQPQKDPKKDK